MLFISPSRFLTLSSQVPCINSLTSLTVLLWMIHDHKYLYQLSSTCEQKPIGEKTTCLQKKIASNQDGRLHSPFCTAFLVSLVKEPSWRWLNTLGQNQYLAGEENDWVSDWFPSTDIQLPPKLVDVTHPWAKRSSYQQPHILGTPIKYINKCFTFIARTIKTWFNQTILIYIIIFHSQFHHIFQKMWKESLFFSIFLLAIQIPASSPRSFCKWNPSTMALRCLTTVILFLLKLW